jgi:hypothetical protein
MYKLSRIIRPSLSTIIIFFGSQTSYADMGLGSSQPSQAYMGGVSYGLFTDFDVDSSQPSLPYMDGASYGAFTNFGVGSSQPSLSYMTDASFGDVFLDLNQNSDTSSM